MLYLIFSFSSAHTHPRTQDETYQEYQNENNKIPKTKKNPRTGRAKILIFTISTQKKKQKLPKNFNTKKDDTKIRQKFSPFSSFGFRVMLMKKSSTTTTQNENVLYQYYI